MKNKLIPLALGLVASLGLAACGGNNNGGGTPTEKLTPTHTPAPTSKPTPYPSIPLTAADCNKTKVPEVFVQSCSWTVKYAAIAKSPTPTVANFMTMENDSTTFYNQFASALNTANVQTYTDLETNYPYVTRDLEYDCSSTNVCAITYAAEGCTVNFHPWVVGGVYSTNAGFVVAAYQMPPQTVIATCQDGTTHTVFSVTPTTKPSYVFSTFSKINGVLIPSETSAALCPGAACGFAYEVLHLR